MHPFNPPYQYIFSTHPRNAPFQPTLSIYLLNTSSQYTLTTNPINLSSQQEHWRHGCMLTASTGTLPRARWYIVSWATSVPPCMHSSHDGCCMVNLTTPTKNSSSDTICIQSMGHRPLSQVAYRQRQPQQHKQNTPVA